MKLVDGLEHHPTRMGRYSIGLVFMFAILPWRLECNQVFAEQVTVREVEAPAEWAAAEQAGRWITTTPVEWEQFQRYLQGQGEDSSPPAPVLMKALYQGEFDGKTLSQGVLQWTVHRVSQVPGFANLGQSNLTVDGFQWGTTEAVHGRSPAGAWMLWCPANQTSLTGRWSHSGHTKLGRSLFQINLPPSLSSRLELLVPTGWQATISGVLGQRLLENSNSEKTKWAFDLGRQQRVELVLEQESTSRRPSMLLRENTFYGLTNTDDLIRIRTDLECTVSGTRDIDLELAVPKTLRVFNVLLGNEIPLKFQRQLGSEDDQLLIPLESLQPGQRVTLRILSETQRRSDRTFIFPRLRPVNALLTSGQVRLAVDRPLEVRGIETNGLRQTQLTEEAGQEIRTYDMTSTDCLLAMQVGEPAAQLQGTVSFLADLRGDNPLSKSLVKLTTREGELFAPQLIVPPGWEVISVEMALGAEIAPAAWQVAPGPGEDSLLTVELKQPIRPDRDCRLLVELRSVRQRPTGVRRLPIPIPRAIHHCEVSGTILDYAAWELDADSTGSVEIVSGPPEEELRKSLQWKDTSTPPSPATGIRVTRYDSKARPLFRWAREQSASPSPLTERIDTSTNSQVLASLEMETRTAKIGLSHPHRVIINFSSEVTPADFRLRLSEVADVARISSDDREISFVRQGEVLILDPATKAFRQLLLEYRTSASPGWIVSRDEIVFPQLNCVVTDFAWHLVLNAERMLYRLPLTAASTPRQQIRSWERFIGPLARHSEETWFNPFRRADWQALINGSSTTSGARVPNDIWLVAAQIPPRLTMKTWDLDVAHGLGWCGLLGVLALGVALRRARSHQFRRNWIYASGVFLVTSLFVAEPYAPVAGGMFLGSVLAILVPRRFAIGRDWLSLRRGAGRSSRGEPMVIASSMLIIGLTGSVIVISQDAHPPISINYFLVPGTNRTRVAFDATARFAWNSWKESVDGPAWLLTACEYQLLSDPEGPPRMSGNFRFAVFDRKSRPTLRLPLAGVSLDIIEGVIDGQPVRLIPASDRSGFILPLPEQLPAPIPRVDSTEPPPPPHAESIIDQPPTLHQVTLRFKPLPEQKVDTTPLYLASLPPVPESEITLLGPRWWISTLNDSQWQGHPAAGVQPEPRAEVPVSVPLGSASVLKITEKPSLSNARDNLSNVRIRTLLESGPLGAGVQIGVLPERVNPFAPTEVEIVIPSEIRVQKIVGAGLDQYEVIERGHETILRLLLAIPETESPTPVEITGFLPGSRSNFEITPPRWRPSPVSMGQVQEEGIASRRHDKLGLLGVVARPGFELTDTSPRVEVTPLSPQSFTDSLFAGMVWQVPDLAWSCSPSSRLSWKVRPHESPGRGILAQTIDVRLPELHWTLVASLTKTESAPFEHTFAIDPRIDLQRAIVQQNGADRLLRWKRTGDLVHLSIRDGQPGVQTVRLEGTMRVNTGSWTPPSCIYQSGQTSQSDVTIRTSPRTVTTLKVQNKTIQIDPQSTSPLREYRYQLDSIEAPQSISVESIIEQRDAFAWLDFSPQDGNVWTVTFRTLWPDQTPHDIPVEVRWNQAGMEDLHQVNRREIIRPVAAGETLLWRPVSLGGRPSELSLTATLRTDSEESLSCALPVVTGLRWKTTWVTVPRTSSYRPIRAQSTLLPETPAHWSDSWKETLSTFRPDLYSTVSVPVTLDRSTTAPQVRPILAETLIWMGGNQDEDVNSLFGVTKYQLISERELNLRIPSDSLSIIRAMSIDGLSASASDTIHVPAQPSDLSHEILVWWKMSTPPASMKLPELIDIPDIENCVHWKGVIPPQQKVLLGAWGPTEGRGIDFWISRSEALLDGAAAFEGANWTVEGPLMHALSDSRYELLRATSLTEHQRKTVGRLEQRWQAFSQSGGSVSSPLTDFVTGGPESGLDATLALCGESRSLWIRPSNEPQDWPHVVDRSWAIVLTAILASAVSLVVLIWLVRIFRTLDIAEKLAARPNGAMIGLGIIWWVGFSPSIFGLVLVLWGGVLWARDLSTARTNTNANPNTDDFR